MYGKPDFINFGGKIVVFVDGCFWHKCPKCFKKPLTNTNFWIKKINNNVFRDKEVTFNYLYSGWKVLRIWEHNLRSSSSGTFIKKKILNSI